MTKEVDILREIADKMRRNHRPHLSPLAAAERIHDEYGWHLASGLCHDDCGECAEFRRLFDATCAVVDAEIDQAQAELQNSWKRYMLTK